VTDLTDPTDLAHERTAADTRRWFQIRLEHLWVLVTLCTIGVFISLVPTNSIDFWWHLKAGELVATSGIPQTNIFAWSLPADTPYIYQSWLGEWLFFAAYQFGGLPATVLLRNLLGLAAFALVALTAYRRSDSWKLASGAVLLALLMTINNLSTRTQNWSWLAFALLLLLLSGYVRGQLGARWLLLLPLLLAFWANAHGAFAIGILVAGAFAVGESLQTLLRWPAALAWRRLRWLLLATAVLPLAALLNPQGPGIYSYVYQLLTDAPVQELVIEWQPPTPRSLAGTFFYGSVLALLAAFAFARRRPRISDVLLVCGLGWLAFTGVRHIVWFGMAAMPLLAQALAAPRTAASEQRALRRPAGSPLINSLLALCLALAVVAVQPWFKPALGLPEPYQELFAPIPEAPLLFHASTPVAATRYLQSNPCGGQLFNDMGFGSYLIWELYPTSQVFIDPRIELFPEAIWNDYVKLSNGEQAAELLAGYNIRCVVLNTATQPGLSAALAELPDWQRTYSDRYSEVWRRVSDA
jgi:hypothetical protein